MEANKLMIGDLVDVHRCECVADGGHYEQWNEYGKVVSITECYITIKYIGREDDYGFEDVDEKDINPIPLTAEILERNGFNLMPKDACGYDNAIWGLDTECGVCVELRTEYGKGLTIWNDTDNDEDALVYLLPLPRYVHELQHALRLCGIDKNIEL